MKNLDFNPKNLKGQCHEIFDPHFFFINPTHLGPWFSGLSIFEYKFDFTEILVSKVDSAYTYIRRVKKKVKRIPI